MRSNRAYLSTWQMFRALLPPWQQTQDPLVSYHLRDQKRVGRRPWGFVIIAYLMLIPLVIYLAALYYSEETQLLTDLFLQVLGALSVGLGLMVMLGHWRLLISVAARSAEAIAGQRRRGDWDLIAITPMSKARWFRAQLTAIGWQVFPILRQLLLVQGLLVLIGMGLLIYGITQDDTSTYYGSERFLPIGVYVLLLLPLVLLLMVEPLLSLFLFTLAGFFASSLSKRTSMSMLYSFFWSYVARLAMAAMFIYGGFIITVLVGGVANALGLTQDFDIDSDIFSNMSIYICGILCLYTLATAFFVEWLPTLGILVLTTPNESSNHAIIYVIIVLTLGMTYIITPWWLMRRLGRSIVWQINQRER